MNCRGTSLAIGDIDHTIPSMTVARRVAWPTEAPDEDPMLSPDSTYSPVRKELDFHPQLWLTEKTSGELVNRVRLFPVALAHAIVKYALTDDRGSRYGCEGMAGGVVAGSILLCVDEAEDDEGRDEDMDGEADVGRGVLARPTEGEEIVW